MAISANRSSVLILLLLLGSILIRFAARSSAMSYRSVLSQLYKVNMYNPVKLGLENMHNLNRVFNYPLKNIPVVHVAGTNGKGSVSLKIAKGLSSVGMKAGLFTSPHISSFRERIQVNQEMLTEEDVTVLLPRIFDTCKQHSIPATFFELTTALALLKFKQSQCDVVVLETGIGGRQDATNIFSAPDMVLSIITSVQLDHQKILGDTIEQIALEKAGVMKCGANVLVGPGCPLALLQTQAERVGARFHTLDSALHPTERRYSRTNVYNNRSSVVAQDIDLLSQDIAAAALKLLHTHPGFQLLPATNAVDSNGNGNKRQAGMNGDMSCSKSTEGRVKAALLVRPPCRFEVFPLRVPTTAGTELPPSINTVQVDVVLDIAHNVAAVQALADKVRLYYPNTPVRLVVGMSADKDVKECLPPLLGLVQGNVQRIHCTQADHPRAMDKELLAANFRDILHTGTVNIAPSPTEFKSQVGNIRQCVQDAVSNAVRDVRGEQSVCKQQTPPRTQADAVVLVCGTAFIMAEARAQLGVIEPKDGDLMSDSEGARDTQEYFADAYTSNTTK